MELTEIDKDCLDELREEYPEAKIPTDDVVRDVLSKMKRGDEVEIDDLIIKIWETVDIVQMEIC